MILHALLLPLNTLRLVQMIRLVREIREASSENSLDPLLPYMKLKKEQAGTVLFNKGDASDRMIVIRGHDDEDGRQSGPVCGDRCGVRSRIPRPRESLTSIQHRGQGYSEHVSRSTSVTREVEVRPVSGHCGAVFVLV